MRRPSTESPFTCATCEAEIAGRPVFHVGLAFCCAGCVADGPCTCSYDDEAGGAAARDAGGDVDLEVVGTGGRRPPTIAASI